MSADKPREAPRVGVGIVIRKNDRVLLMRRQGAHGSGSWSTPGGHLDPGESPETCSTPRAATTSRSGWNPITPQVNQPSPHPTKRLRCGGSVGTPSGPRWASAVRLRPVVLIVPLVLHAACTDSSQDQREAASPPAISPTVLAEPGQWDVTDCAYHTSASLPPQWETLEPPYLNVEGYSCSDAAVIRLERSVSPDDGRVRWDWVMDVVTDPLAPGEMFVLLYCRDGVEHDTGIVAIATEQDEPVLTEIREAWVVDTAAVSIRSLATDSITCGNEDYGV